MGINSYLNSFLDKTVLVTGASGFKGSWLCLMLKSLGANVIGFSLSPYTVKDNFVITGLNKKINHIVGDVNNFHELDSVFKTFKPEFIFHLAAQPLVIESYKNPLDTYKSNVMGTLNVLELVRIHKFVRGALFITSDKCYDINSENINYRENDKLGGVDPYSASKAACEIIIQSHIKSFFSTKDSSHVASVRAGNVIGGGDWSKNRLVPDCIRSINENRPIILRNPNSIRPWQHVLDPLNGYLMLADRLLSNKIDFQGAWNFGPKEKSEYSVLEVVQQIIIQIGKGSVEINVSPNEYIESKILLIDITKAMKKLNWYPKIGYEKMIKMTVEEYMVDDMNENEVFQQRIDHINDYFRNVY